MTIKRGQLREDTRETVIDFVSRACSDTRNFTPGSVEPRGEAVDPVLQAR